MANKIAIGTELLFVLHAGGEIKSGRVEEYSPSGKYVGISHDRGGAWYQLSTLAVVEVLKEPAKEVEGVPEPFVPDAELQKREAALQVREENLRSRESAFAAAALASQEKNDKSTTAAAT